MTSKPPSSAARLAAPTLPVHYRLAVALRALAGVGLGYVLAAQAASLLALLWQALGMHRADAVTLAIMLAFILYACALLWAFACPSGWRVWRALGAGVLACTALLWWAQSGAGAA
ncbi:MAG: iron transporter [Comamonadaceae bacterium]|nr:iron transporter [Comamonadaceae bacterium]